MKFTAPVAIVALALSVSAESLELYVSSAPLPYTHIYMDTSALPFLLDSSTNPTHPHSPISPDLRLHTYIPSRPFLPLLSFPYPSIFATNTAPPQPHSLPEQPQQSPPRLAQRRTRLRGARPNLGETNQ